MKILKYLWVKLKGIDSNTRDIYWDVRFTFRDTSSGNINIGYSSTLSKGVELRCYDNSRIMIGSKVKLDDGVRIIAANNSTITIEDNVKIGKGTIINGGANCRIGRYTLISGYCYIQCSNHGNKLFPIIQKQQYVHKEITIGSDCLIGCYSFIAGGSKIEDGVICGSNSYVDKQLIKNGIYIGQPVTLKRYRE